MPEPWLNMGSVVGYLRNFGDMYRAAEPFFDELNDMLNEQTEIREKNTPYNEAE